MPRRAREADLRSDDHDLWAAAKLACRGSGYCGADGSCHRGGDCFEGPARREHEQSEVEELKERVARLEAIVARLAGGGEVPPPR